MKSTKDVDARADVWSLGVVLYQLIAGKLPFTGDSLPTLCLSVLNDDPPPLSAIRADLPDGLSDVVMRALAKEVADRYPDVAELSQALLPFASPAGIGSVTKVRSMLHGRQEAGPSETFPLGFATVSPTLLGTGPAIIVPDPGDSGEALDNEPETTAFQAVDPASISEPLPRVRATTRDLSKPVRPARTLPPEDAFEISDADGDGEERPVGTTTLGSATGESLAAIPRRHFPIGLVGALCAAIGFVVVLIVMVMRRNQGGDDKPVVAPPPKPPPAIEIIDASPIRVEPITPDAPDPAAQIPVDAADDPIEIDPGGGSAVLPDKPPGTKKTIRKVPRGGNVRRGNDRPPDKSDRPDPPAPPPPATPDAGVDAEDDKWGHMTHDTPKVAPEPPKKKP